jgi:hypothetical protein
VYGGNTSGCIAVMSRLRGPGEKLHIVERAMEHRHRVALGAGEIVVLHAASVVRGEQLIRHDGNRAGRGGGAVHVERARGAIERDRDV